MTYNYELLVEQIVRTAVEDYQEALRKKNNGRISALTRWFRSEWGQMLTYHNSEYILAKAKKEVIENEKANS